MQFDNKLEIVSVTGNKKSLLQNKREQGFLSFFWDLCALNGAVCLPFVSRGVFPRYFSEKDRKIIGVAVPNRAGYFRNAAVG